MSAAKIVAWASGAQPAEDRRPEADARHDLTHHPRLAELHRIARPEERRDEHHERDRKQEERDRGAERLALLLASDLLAPRGDGSGRAGGGASGGADQVLDVAIDGGTCERPPSPVLQVTVPVSRPST